MPLLLRLLLAAVSGAAVAISFEPYGLVYLLPVGVAGLSLLVQRISPGRGFLVGAVFGTSFMLTLLPWLQVIGGDAWVALSLFEGVFYGLLGLGAVLVQRLRWWPLWTAMLWVAVEALRSSFPFGGFPWGRLAFATADTPAAGLFGYVGSAGTTFGVALIGTALAWAVLEARRTPALGVAVVALPVLLVSSGALYTPWVASPEEEPTDVVSVAAVQGDVPGEGMAAFAERRVVLENHVEATHELADRVEAGRSPRPDLVVWPENSTDIDPFADATVYADIQGAVDAIGVPVLVGAMVSGEEPEDVYNQGIVWLPGAGPAQTYSKTHPVPFGEYIPFRDVFAPYIGRLEQIPRDMVPGTEPGLLTMGGTTVGDVICFEVAYDELTRAVVGGGADLVVVQTNNATYMGTGQIEQQFAISRLRAIETNRYVVVAATNGVSGIIGPDGQVVERAPTRERSVLVRSLPVHEATTPALFWGPVVELVLTLGAGVSVAAALFVNYRRRRAGAAVATERPRETVAAGKAEG
ncbi:MAG TPA: apolipoprotein N-acyltransferase [Nocardioidaceae bacterium]|nr:apolipoprotein N-acyltransferase [Nocardioidaceae bacterium]